MIGAIIGDYVGSIYEMNNIRTTQFPLFSKGCTFTDDTIMTLAIAQALTTDRDYARSLREYGKLYPDAGYGRRFLEWVNTPDAPAYNSFGNGSAMRVSPVGWYAQSLEEALALARDTAMPTHNHPDGVLGAQVVAGCIFLLRQGKSKDEIRAWVEEMGYPMNQTIAQLQKSYKFDVSCRGSVPQAIQAFLESTDFESAIRLAISIGGDSDTIASIAGALAEVVYRIPGYMVNEIRIALRKHAPRNLEELVLQFGVMLSRRSPDGYEYMKRYIESRSSSYHPEPAGKLWFDDSGKKFLGERHALCNLLRENDICVYSLTPRGEKTPKYLIAKVMRAGCMDNYLQGTGDAKCHVVMELMDYDQTHPMNLFTIVKGLNAILRSKVINDIEKTLYKKDGYFRDLITPSEFFSIDVDPASNDPGAQIYLRDKAHFL